MTTSRPAVSGAVCADCGFAWGDLPTSSFGPAMSSLQQRYAARLAAAEPALLRRPAPDVWSPLEYACHVRDVLWAQRDRVYLALVEDRPSGLTLSALPAAGPFDFQILDGGKSISMAFSGSTR